MCIKEWTFSNRNPRKEHEISNKEQEISNKEYVPKN